MIRHTVLFKIKPNIQKNEIQDVFTQVVNLGHQLPGILSITGGTCYFYDQISTKIFTHGFSIDFQDQRSRDAFLNDPITYPVKESIVEIVEGSYDGIIGFDFGEWSS